MIVRDHSSTISADHRPSSIDTLTYCKNVRNIDDLCAIHYETICLFRKTSGENDICAENVQKQSHAEKYFDKNSFKRPLKNIKYCYDNSNNKLVQTTKIHFQQFWK